jgi:hypothetical protein
MGNPGLVGPYRELYMIYREPAAVNKGRFSPGLRIVGVVVVFTRAFTIRNATLHGFITTSNGTDGRKHASSSSLNWSTFTGLT